MQPAEALFGLEVPDGAHNASGDGSGDTAYYQFGPFELRAGEQVLLRDGMPVALNYRAFAVLEMLVKQAGHVVEKTELLNTVWKDCFVEEGNLTVTISAIRKALEDPRNEQKYIKTVSGHGYRFVKVIKVVSKGGTRSSSPVPPLATDPVPSAVKPGLKIWQKAPSAWLSVLTVLLLGVGIARLLTNAHGSVAATPPVHALAILPFRNASPDAAQAQLNIEFTEGLINRLGEDGTIEVRSMESVLKYVDRTVDPVSAGNEQQADAVLTGTVATTGGHVNVTAQLMRVKDGSILWHGAFESSRNGMLDLEDQLEESLAQPLFPKRAAAHTTYSGTHDPEAHRLYQEGLYFWERRSESGIRRSIEDFQAATLKDPNYALAYAGMADAYASLAIHNVESAEQAYSNARAAAAKALQLDNSLVQPHRTMATISLYFEWNPSKAEQELRKAIQLNPSLPVSHAWYAADLAAGGKMDQALNEAMRAVRLDPVSPAMAAELGRIYYWNRQYSEAIAELNHSIDLAPEYPAAHIRLGTTYLVQKQYEAAIREFRRAKLLFRGNSEIDGLIGYAEAASGNVTAARRILNELHERSAHEYIPAYAVALIYIGLNDRSAAFEWLEKCRQERPASLVFARVDPLFDPLRTDSRFSNLLSEIGLGEDKTVTLASAR